MISQEHKKMAAIRVYNYNILSTKLCDPKWHNKCSPHHLETKHRWNLISSRLLEQVALKSIICLQELSDEWISLLLPFFSSLEYVFVYDSQWLGVGIAFPKSKYELQNMDMIAIGETIKKQCHFYPKIHHNIIRRGINTICDFLASFIPGLLRPEDVWTTAIRKTNRLLSVTLNDFVFKETFNVFTYHMPCAFTNPDLMNIHAAALLAVVQEKSMDPLASTPYILAGDFNSKPNSPVYQMITCGVMPLFPSSKVYQKIPNYSIIGIASAYASILGREPSYTNYSHASISKEPFKDTIDYIFYSNGFKCTGVLKTREDFPESTFPNAEEPSDHLPIGASFDFAHHTPVNTRLCKQKHPKNKRNK